MFRFKVQIAENSLLLLRFATLKRDIFALKKQFMTYSEVPLLVIYLTREHYTQLRHSLSHSHLDVHS